MAYASEQGQYLADICWGVGGVSKAATKHYRVPGHLYELTKGEEFNLCYVGLLKRLERDVREGRLVAAMLATPCTSWSMARNRTNVIRSRSEPWGVAKPPKPLSEHDRASLKAGNSTMRATLKFIKIFEEHDVPLCLENPASSNTWHVRALKKIISKISSCLVEVDQCSYGQPWRKRTKQLFGLCDISDVLSLATAHKCDGRRVCSFSRREHLQLTGSGPDGKPLTARAQIFPARMCNELARLLLQRHLHKRACRA